MSKHSALLSSTTTPTELICGLAAHAPGVATANFQVAPHLWNIGYTLSGTVHEVLPDNETWQHAGDFMVLKPNGLHRWEVPRKEKHPWRVVWFLLTPKPEWVPLLDLAEEFPRFSRISLKSRKNHFKIRRALLNAYWLATSPKGGTSLAMNAVERALLWLEADQHARHQRMDPRIEATMELFSKRLSNPPSIAEAATACGLSSSRLQGLFLASTGRSPQDWLDDMRLKQARYLLLSTGLPIKSISAAVGYNDQRYFATRFRLHFGLTPSEYRERELNQR